MEILTDLQLKILKSFAGLTDQEAFYLTGGTALSAFFLQHRRSRDLDFFTATEEVISLFSRKLELSLTKEGLQVGRLRGLQSFVEITVNSDKEQTLIHFALDSPFRFEEPFLSEEIPGLKIDSLIDMATNKLLALFGRAALRDFIDVYFLCQERFKKDELLRKCSQKDAGFDLYWLGVAMEKIDEFTEDDTDMLLLNRTCPLEELKIFFRSWRQEISRALSS